MSRAAPSKAADAPPALDLSAFLPYRLSVLANRISSALARRYAERFDLTIPEWRVIAVLGPCPGLTAVEICDLTAMDKVQVSRAVARLIAAKRLSRRIDAKDRRRAVLTFTPAGMAVYEAIVPLALSFEAALTEALRPGDRAALDHLIERLETKAVQLGGSAP